jgi:hypothetical protein
MKTNTVLNPSKFILFFLFFAIFQSAFGQIVVDEAPRAHYYMRTARVKKFRDMKDFRDVFHYDKLLLGRNRFSGSVSYNFGRVLINDGRQFRNEYRSALGFFMRWRFFEDFSLNTTFFYDFNKRAAARWVADYSYSVGRYNWRPHKWNFGYENYVNNKYTDAPATIVQKFTEGYLFLSYNYVLPDVVNNLIRIDSTSSLKFTPVLRHAFRYRDEFEKVHYEGKPSAGLMGRLTLFWNIYVEGGVYYYFTPTFRQLPWDPDYTYGFGYFDWRSFRLSLTYGNWAVNRWPGRKSDYPHYNFLDGNFRIVANWIW